MTEAGLPRAVLDSCVLYPPGLRNLFMWLAVEELFMPKWTAKIHEEWMENALEDDAKKNFPPRLERAKLERTRDLMDRHAPRSLVTGYEHWIPTLSLSQRTEQLVEMSAMRQELLRQLVTAQEQERGRISRDLHDDTGQQISALLLGLRSVQDTPTVADDSDLRATLTRLEALAGDVAQKSHRLSFTLRPTALDDQGLMGALGNYVEEWSHWSRLPVELESVGLETEEGTVARLPREIETTIYRVVQEALTNVLRYASATGEGTASGGGSAATRVSILVQRRGGEVLAVVEDNGPGFDVEVVLNQPPGKRRLGIFGMQERARLVGGTLTIESETGEGTSVYLRLPLS